MKTTARRIARCFPVFLTSKRKRTRRIVALFFILLFLGIYFVLAQFEQTGLIGLKMSNTRTFASENSFSWDSVLDALEHTEEGDFLRYDKGKTKSKQTHDKLKVIVLLHSHNDPGYKYTYDQYYFNKTKHVLSLAVEKLTKYQDMTFIWTDTCFLDRIWKELSDEMKANLKYLVKTGRFEISLGAWVSADECVTHYYSYIDQLIEGYSWIRQHFDVFPNVSFNMDQFGTSSSIHYIRRKVGIRHSVYNHIHKGTKVFFRKNRLLEFNLKQSLINNMDSFVHVEPFDDLGFKGSCGPSAKICSKLALTKTTLSFDKSLPRNATSMDFAEQLVSQIRLKSEMYLHNVLFLPVGDDLVYITSQEWDNQYKNLKKLMQYINDKSKWKIDMQFGTLSQYFRELEKVASKSVKQFPTVSGDLFPYTRGPKYWSGYFTTRQFVKRLGRELQESVRATEMLIAFTIPNTIERINQSNKFRLIISKLIHARRQLGIFQHHDAITGTSETSVIKDYKQRLSRGYVETQEVLAFLLKSLLENQCESVESQKDHDNSESKACNISIIPTTFRDDAETLTKSSEVYFQRNESYLILYNSFTQPRTELISFSVKHEPAFMMFDNYGQRLNYDVQKVDNISVITFIAQLSPMSLSQYRIVKTKQVSEFRNEVKVKLSQHDERLVCENSEMRVEFSSTGGSPEVICSKKENKCRDFEIELIHYTTASDAYTFSNISDYVKITEVLQVRKLSGNSYCSVEFDYKFIKIRYILEQTKGLNGQRLKMDIYDNLSGGDFLGDFAIRLKTGIDNKNTFYTDSNGMQLKKRMYRSNLSFGANIYPMTSVAVIEDEVNRLNVYSTQPHGVVSLKPGSLDITIDRVVVSKSDLTVTEFVENTFDNVPTLSHLYFNFEAIREPVNKRKTSDNLKPSLESILTDDYIQHRVFAFYAQSDFKPIQNTFLFLNQLVPKELVIANVKTLFGDNLDYNGISLTLFRRFISSERVSENPIVFNPESLFKWTKSKTRFMFNDDIVTKHSYTFMPFDLQTFLIQ